MLNKTSYFFVSNESIVWKCGLVTVDQLTVYTFMVQMVIPVHITSAASPDPLLERALDDVISVILI